MVAAAWSMQNACMTILLPIIDDCKLSRSWAPTLFSWRARHPRGWRAGAPA